MVETGRTCVVMNIQERLELHVDANMMVSLHDDSPCVAQYFECMALDGRIVQ